LIALDKIQKENKMLKLCS